MGKQEIFAFAHGLRDKLLAEDYPAAAAVIHRALEKGTSGTEVINDLREGLIELAELPAAAQFTEETRQIMGQLMLEIEESL